jgi:miniconductance mechanosensitive channel
VFVVFGFLQEWLRGRGIEASAAAAVALTIELAAVLAIAVLAHFIVRTVVVRGVARLVRRTSNAWDDALVGRGVVARLAHIAPALVIYHFGATVLGAHP